MEWDPTQFFREDESIQPHPFVLLVLNHPINETALAILRKRGMLYIPCAPFAHPSVCTVTKSSVVWKFKSIRSKRALKD